MTGREITTLTLVCALACGGGPSGSSGPGEGSEDGDASVDGDGTGSGDGDGDATGTESGESEGETDGGCSAGQACVGAPPPEWSGPVVVAFADVDAPPACPVGFAPAAGAESFGPLEAPDLGCGCEAATLEGGCAPPILQGYQNSNCTTQGGNPIELTDEVCKGNFVFLYFKVAAPEPEGPGCVAQPTKDPDAMPAFAQTTVACAAPAGASCPEGECIDVGALAGAAACIFQDGEVDCPPGYPDQHVQHRSFSDQRECACDVELQDASCDGTLTGYWGDPCFGNQEEISYGVCTYAVTQSWMWDGGLAGACDTPTPMQTGTIDPTEPVTFCCAA